MHTIEDRLNELNITLPSVKSPAFNYMATVTSGNLCYISGQLPWLEDGGLITGKVAESCSIDEARGAAERCVLAALSQLKHTLGDLDSVVRVVKLTGFVSSASGFIEQPRVLDAASDLLVQIFGERGRHSRSAVGVAELPRGVPVEIEFVIEIAVS